MKKNSAEKKVLLFTRPLSAPWDEASKNLAFEIAKSCFGDFSFRLLTDNKDQLLEELSTSKDQKTTNNKFDIKEIYSSKKFNFFQRLRLLMWFFYPNSLCKVVHFLFTPRSLTSCLIRFRLFFSSAKTVQTIATFNEKTYSNKKLRKIFFGNVVIVQSRYTQEKLKKRGLLNSQLIYPGIDLNKFSPASKSQELLERFRINSNDFVLLFPGEYSRLNAIENILTFLEILDKKKELKHWKFIFACRIKNKADEKEKKRVTEEVKKKGIEKRIIFIDTFPDMPSLYNLADLIFFPIREMTGKFDIPLALVEAMASRKPVLVSDIPVLEEFVKNSQTGIVVPKEDPEKIYDIFIHFIKNGEKLDEIAKQGFEFVRKNFDIKVNVQRYKKIYEDLMK